MWSETKKNSYFFFFREISMLKKITVSVLWVSFFVCPVILEIKNFLKCSDLFEIQNLYIAS